MFGCDVTLDVVDWPSAGVVLKGFSNVEDNFVWQTGRFGEITFDFQDTKSKIGAVDPKAASVDLMLDIDVFKHQDGYPGQNVFIYLNGLRVGSFYVSYRRVVICNVLLSTLRAKNNVLTFDTPDAVSPRKVGVEDDRVLGVQVFSMQFRRDA